MERRFHLHANPYVASNPYAHNVGRQYGSKGRSSGTRSSSSWVLWEPQSGKSRGSTHSTCCSLLTLLVLLLVLLGVLAVAGLALYMGALRLEPVQSFLVFDGSMRVIGDKYNVNLANKSSIAFHEKSRRYQTLFGAVYQKSLIGPSVHVIDVTSFANGSLIVFFRVVLDRKKIPKPINSIEETLKDVILHEASSPLSVLNALRIDAKEIHIKRFFDEPKQYGAREELSTVIVPIEPKRRQDVDVKHATSERSDLVLPSTGEGKVKRIAGQTIQGSYTVTSSEPKNKKVASPKEEMAIVTPTQSMYNRRTTKTTTESSDVLSTKHSPALKRFLQEEKATNKTEATSTTPTTTTTTTTQSTTTKRPTTQSTTSRTTTTNLFELDDEPWRPIIPDNVREIKDRVDFDYGVGEAEVVLDSLIDPPMNNKPPSSGIKLKPLTTRGKVEEVQVTPPTYEARTTYAYAEKVEKPKIAVENFNEQKSMPELSILQQFHNLDSFLKTYSSQGLETRVNERRPTVGRPSAVVTLLPVRSNVGVRATLRPRPKDEETTTVFWDSVDETSPNLIHSTTTETVETKAPKRPMLQQIFLTAESDMVAIPLQKYFTASPLYKQEPVRFLTVPTVAPKRNYTTPRSDISLVTEGLQEIAIVGTDNLDISSQRSLLMNNTDLSGTFSRQPKMPNFDDFGTTPERPTGNMSPRRNYETLSLLEVIFRNLTTTARSVKNGTEASDVYYHSLRSHPFDMNNTADLTKLANLKISFPNETKTGGENKVANNAIATSFPSIGNPFKILTKVFNKASEKPDTANETESASFELLDCPQNTHFKCDSGECVLKSMRCNKFMDCKDGSDERNCSCADFLRTQGHKQKICDGIYDCWDHSDEQNCAWCSTGQHLCTNSKMCIDSTQVCDGFPHCPHGDDERNCIAVSPSTEEAAEKDYHSSGYIMVQKEGAWGKMCFQNFDNIISQSNSDWSLEDLGQSICQKLTYRFFDGIFRQKDDTAQTTLGAPVYYELSLTEDRKSSNGNSQNTREKFAFQKTTCIEKEVAEIKCRDLECGIRPEASIPWTNERKSRVVGGGSSAPGSWPWQAALYKEGEFLCGATLISKTWLLSAGHCFYNSQSDYWVARLGALRKGSPSPPYEQLRTISQIIVHPEYDEYSFFNDISLLRMSKPIVLSTYVRPICLPSPWKSPKNGDMCTVVGWGQLYEDARIFPDTLQEVQLPVISTAECRKRTVFLPFYQVSESMFCAGYDRGGRDACMGDSGGPFMCQENDGKWVLHGVTSNGYGCARPNRPGVYTKVTSYLPWVEETMKTKEPGRGPPKCSGHRCPLGKCLQPAQLCNGFIECRDSSDEQNC